MSFVDGQSSINLVRLKFRKHQQKGPISLPVATTVFSISRRTGQQKWRQLRALERENRQLREWVGKFVNGVTGVTGCRVRSICLLREKVLETTGRNLNLVFLFLILVVFLSHKTVAKLRFGGWNNSWFMVPLFGLVVFLMTPEVPQSQPTGGEGETFTTSMHWRRCSK